jgi:MYXO-CTERM domain-containing protein
MKLTRALMFVVCLSGLALPASAQVTWRGDFETGDTSQYGYLLNPEVEGRRYIDVVEDVVAEGDHACRIELHDDAVWPGNGLKRVEVQHSPDDGLIAEGTEIYFAWSFYLPETLPRDPDQTIGYWESEASYRQLMAFAVIGEDLRFSTNRPDWHEHWTGEGVVTPRAWHRIAMHVLWSTDAATGTVDVWFDGEQVVTAGHAATLADANAAFVQFGLLRGAIEFTDVPVIYVDDAIEGRSLADVHHDTLPGEVPDAGASVDAGGAGTDAAAVIDAAAARDAGVARTDGGTSTAPAASCACRAGNAPSTAGHWALVVGVALVFARRRVRW